MNVNVTCIGCVNIRETHVTANNSINDNIGYLNIDRAYVTAYIGCLNIDETLLTANNST